MYEKLEKVNLTKSSESTMPSTSFEKENSKAESSQCSTADSSLSGLCLGDQEKLEEYVTVTFLRKYDQGNYESIKKATKFYNAIANFVAQTLESKKFKRAFGLEKDDGVIDQVRDLLYIL
mmetsp:Transcript_13903/g.16115  ORF Transcript_13903/g.16115 Transcript_13903/m.16115 type:complete len:120 (-) Transcript_13903:69-428(-)